MSYAESEAFAAYLRQVQATLDAIRAWEAVKRRATPGVTANAAKVAMMQAQIERLNVARDAWNRHLDRRNPSAAKWARSHA